MTMCERSGAPRWGGVARDGDSGSHAKPQETSSSVFRTLQDRAGLSANVSGTSRKIGTPLTQAGGDLFATRSALSTWIKRQTDQSIICNALILIRSLDNYLKQPSDALLKQIAANTASLSARVGR